MDPTTQARIDASLSEWEKGYIRYLTQQAVRSHLKGDIEAYRIVKMTPEDFNVINTAAIEYGMEYEELLTTEGATMINGQKVYWMRDYSEKQRQDVYTIIEDGIREGKNLGTKESGKGTYPKNSVAADLQQYFDGRKSHASMVARTETLRIRNQAQMNRWKDLGFNRVKVLDDELEFSCQACKDANGQIWDLEFARTHESEHPNCVRTFSPISDRGGEDNA